MEKPAQVLIAGVMSGTSADGVDVAMVRVTCDRGDFPSQVESIKAELRQYYGEAYPPEVREAILALRGGAPFTWKQLADAGRQLTLAHVDAVKKCLAAAQCNPSEIDAIADHGQTFFHDPPDSIQWLDPALLAAQVGCSVICDFRRADCAAGGQGAPLVPFADHILFRHPSRSRVLLNIGGIANLTFLPANGSLRDVIAFDTGPGNCISDALVSKHSPATGGFDPAGAMAAEGKSIEGLFDRMLEHRYFREPPPKSTDRPELIRWFDEVISLLAPRATLNDKLHAACELTARSIACAIERFLPHPPTELFVSGGGVENATLMRMLESQLRDIPIRRTDELGIAAQAKEAIAFAILGAATLWGIPANVPSATGAAREVILGSVTLRPV